MLLPKYYYLQSKISRTTTTPRKFRVKKRRSTSSKFRGTTKHPNTNDYGDENRPGALRQHIDELRNLQQQRKLQPPQQILPQLIPQQRPKKRIKKIFNHFSTLSEYQKMKQDRMSQLYKLQQQEQQQQQQTPIPQHQQQQMTISTPQFMFPPPFSSPMPFLPFTPTQRYGDQMGYPAAFGRPYHQGGFLPTLPAARDGESAITTVEPPLPPPPGQTYPTISSSSQTPVVVTESIDNPAPAITRLTRPEHPEPSDPGPGIPPGGDGSPLGPQHTQAHRDKPHPEISPPQHHNTTIITTTQSTTTTVDPLNPQSTADYLEEDYTHEDWNFPGMPVSLGVTVTEPAVTKADNEILSSMIAVYERPVAYGFHQKVKDWMKENNQTGIWSGFIMKLATILARKNDTVLMLALKGIHDAVNYHELRIKELGEPLAGRIMSAASTFISPLPDAYRSQLILLVHALRDRRTIYKHTRINKALDWIDSLINQEDEQDMLEILEAYDKYDGSDFMIKYAVPPDWKGRANTADILAVNLIDQFIFEPLLRLKRNDVNAEVNLLYALNQMLVGRDTDQIFMPTVADIIPHPSKIGEDLDDSTVPVNLNIYKMMSKFTYISTTLRTYKTTTPPTIPRPRRPDRRIFSPLLPKDTIKPNRTFESKKKVHIPPRFRSMLNKTLEMLKKKYEFKHKITRKFPITSQTTTARIDSRKFHITSQTTTPRIELTRKELDEEISSGGQQYLKKQRQERLMRQWGAKETDDTTSEGARRRKEHHQWFKPRRPRIKPQLPNFRAGHKKRKHRRAKKHSKKHSHKTGLHDEVKHKMHKYDKFMEKLDKYSEKKMRNKHHHKKREKDSHEREHLRERKHKRHHKHKKELKRDKKHKRHGKKKHREAGDVRRRIEEITLNRDSTTGDDSKTKETFRGNKRFQIIGKSGNKNSDSDRPLEVPRPDIDRERLIKNRFSIVKRNISMSRKKKMTPKDLGVPFTRGFDVDNEEDPVMDKSENGDSEYGGSAFKANRRLYISSIEHLRNRRHAHSRRKNSHRKHKRKEQSKIVYENVPPLDDNVPKRLNISGFIKQIKKSFFKRLAHDTKAKMRNAGASFNYRRSGRNLTRSSEQTDEEHVLKANIYKAFGYGSPLTPYTTRTPNFVKKKK